MNPKGWDKEELQNWLSQSLTQEDDSFDLKERIPDDEEGKCRLKKEFCGFANGRGGFIFFGIDENKKIIGISKKDSEFNTRLSQIVTSHIFPPTIKWQPYESIDLKNNDKCVYIIKIFESVYFQKPHVFFKQGKGLFVPIREHGHLRHLTDGSEIRRVFLNADGYYSEYNVHVIEIMKNIKGKTDPGFSLLETNIIQGFKSYLRSNNDEKISEIILALENIEKKVADLRKSFMVNITEGGTVDLTDKEELGRSIDSFIEKYRIINL